SAWMMPLPNDISVDQVRILAATIEYKKKLTEVKVNDWFDMFKHTKKPADMHAHFMQSYKDKGIFNIEEVSVKTIEKSIENVSLEWAEARMRLCDFIARTIFKREKLQLEPHCAKAVLAEVDRLTALEPLSPFNMSIAVGRFSFHPGDTPRWTPFNEFDVPLLVIPA
ncbi:hypothetical protein PMAYCL1PPCAC_31636, partial [Pristionchus mayeri]